MKDSWLKPNGQIIEVGTAQHNTYAGDLLEEEMGFEEMMQYLDDNNMCSPYEILHAKGWIRIKYSHLGKISILGDCIDMTKPMRNTIDPPMNNVQIRIAKDLCIENNTPFLDAINHSRFR